MAATYRQGPNDPMRFSEMEKQHLQNSLLTLHFDCRLPMFAVN